MQKLIDVGNNIGNNIDNDINNDIDYDIDNVNHNRKPILNINIDEIEPYYRLFKDDINSNHDKYMQFIKSNHNVHNDYLKLCESVCNMQICQSSQSDQYNQHNQYNQSKQIGGNMLTAGIVIGSFVITNVIASLLWYFLNPSEKCDQTYPLYPKDQIPNIEDIVKTILPKSWIKEITDTGKTTDEAIEQIGEQLNELTKVFSTFDESVGTTSTKFLKSLTKISLSIGAAVLTSGMGGDKAVNFPVFITKSLNMITRTFNKLVKVTGQINESLKTVTTNYGKITNTIKQTKALINENRESGKNQLLFIYDLFNIDFSGGPFHTECWVNYVMGHYIQNTKNKKDIYALLCMMNDIYMDVNKSVMEFVGSTLDMVVPESMGILGTITPLLGNYNYVLYKRVRKQITNNYNRIPHKYKILIQNPKKMSTFIFDKFNEHTFHASELIIKGNFKKHMEKGIDLLAYGLNKGLGLMYMFLNVFIIFSEINANVTNALITHNLAGRIDVNTLLMNCVKCGNIKMYGINEDLTICKKCRQFYMDNDDNNVDVDDAKLYEKCKTYVNKRKLMKVGRRNNKPDGKQKAPDVDLNSFAESKKIEQLGHGYGYENGYKNEYEYEQIDTLQILNKIYREHQDSIPEKIIKLNYIDNTLTNNVNY